MSLLSTDVCRAPVVLLVLETLGAGVQLTPSPCAEVKLGSKIWRHKHTNGMWRQEGVQSPKQDCDKDVPAPGWSGWLLRGRSRWGWGQCGGHSLQDRGAEGACVLGSGFELCAAYQLHSASLQLWWMNCISSFPWTCQPAWNDSKDRLDTSLSSLYWITQQHKTELTFLQYLFLCVSLFFLLSYWLLFLINLCLTSKFYSWLGLDPRQPYVSIYTPSPSHLVNSPRGDGVNCLP